MENVAADLDLQVGSHAEDMAVEGGVVQLAHCQTIRDHRKTLGMAVGKDVGSVEQLAVAQPADGTLLAVGVDHVLAEQ